MTDVGSLGKAAWRDFNTDGVPSSGARKPYKPDIREFAAEVEKQKATTVETFAALRQYGGAATHALVKARTTFGDGGGGEFAIKVGDTSTADDGALVLVDTLGRRWWRVYDGHASVRWWGARGNGVADDIAPITAAVSTGEALYWPPGTYRITGVITANTRQDWRGDKAIIKLDNSTRGYIIPLLIVGAAASESTFVGMEFDHDANGVPEPAMVNGLAYAHCCCVINMASDVSFDQCVARNAWDSGFANGRWTWTGTGAPGSPLSLTLSFAYPQRARFADCRGYNCGLGVHTTFDSGNQAGGGFNNLNGSLTLFDACISLQCSTGFINDFGAQASANFVNCKAYESTRDPGWGFWIADGPCALIGCWAMHCESDGFVVPYQANGITLDGCYSFANGKNGYLIGSAKTTATGCIAQDNSQATVNTYSGFHLNSGDEALNTLSLVGCHAIGTTHKHGLSASGGNSIQAQWAFGSLEGATSAYSIGSYSIQVVVQGAGARNMGIDTPVPSARLSVSSDVTTYTTTPLGDSGNGGTIAAHNATTPGKKLAMAYDGTADAAVVQAMHAGVTVKPLLLNPSGGNVLCGVGAWNTGHMVMGPYHLWVDTSDRLRIKNGVPSSATDGVIVGSQS